MLIFTIVSVEDANGCKRNLNVPGVTINVRRVKVSWICCGCTSIPIGSVANGKVLRQGWDEVGQDFDGRNSILAAAIDWRRCEYQMENQKAWLNLY